MPPEDEGDEEAAADEPSSNGAEEPAGDGIVEASSSENGDLPVEDLVEEAPEAAQEDEEMDAGEAPPPGESADEEAEES